MKNLINYFKKSAFNKYDFSKMPKLIFKKNNNNFNSKKNNINSQKWFDVQKHFLSWTKDKSVFNKEYIKKGYQKYNKDFSKLKIIRGDVLDIGGGWGLFRQWWHRGKLDWYLVHDPGVERFLAGAYSYHKIYYKKAMSYPMTFVEGIGESLPYQNDIFDTILIASTLDHCFDPSKVIGESYKCLKKNGKIVIIQACQDGIKKKIKKSIWKKIKSHHIKEYPRIGFNLIFKKDDHLHHFTKDGLLLIFKKHNFNVVKSIKINSSTNLYLFELEKE